jgi:hypothetical protein
VKTRTLIARSSVVAVLLLAAACGDPDDPGNGDDDPIVIGSTLSLTGAFGPYIGHSTPLQKRGRQHGSGDR